jgi:hypothetical protein
MRMLNMPSWGAQVFFFERGGGDFLVSQHVPIRFSKHSTSSQVIPKDIPKDIPNTNSILSHMICPKLPCKYKVKRGAHVFVFGHLESKDMILLLGSAQHSKKIGEGLNQYGPFPQKNKINK